MEPFERAQYWVNHLGFLMRKRLGQAFAEHGHRVSAEEWAVLLLLRAQDGMTATELSARTFRDKTTIARMIDKMAAKSLVSRTVDPSDRRVIRLALTEAGDAQFAQLAEVARTIIARSESGLASGDLATTVATLERMARNLGDKLEEDDEL